MPQADKCPKCNITWLGEKIPQGLLKGSPHYYTSLEKAEEAAEDYGWTKENQKRFTANVIGIEDRDLYDGVSFWQCLSCKVTFGRGTLEEVKE